MTARESLLRDAALCAADDLLRRLSEWDHLPLTGDGPFWLREIARVRAEIDKAMGE